MARTEFASLLLRCMFIQCRIVNHNGRWSASEVSMAPRRQRCGPRRDGRGGWRNWLVAQRSCDAPLAWSGSTEVHADRSRSLRAASHGAFAAAASSAHGSGRGCETDRLGRVKRGGRSVPAFAGHVERRSWTNEPVSPSPPQPCGADNGGPAPSDARCVRHRPERAWALTRFNGPRRLRPGSHSAPNEYAPEGDGYTAAHEARWNASDPPTPFVETARARAVRRCGPRLRQPRHQARFKRRSMCQTPVQYAESKEPQP
jgi:hypothetical protein